MEENKIKLWDKIQRGMEAGFDAAMSAVHTITEKARERHRAYPLKTRKSPAGNLV